MDGVPYKSKKRDVETIAQALGISERTAREWVKEVRQLLAEHEGVKHLKKLRVGARS
jgi:transcriptional antiterminator